MGGPKMLSSTKSNIPFAPKRPVNETREIAKFDTQELSTLPLRTSETRSNFGPLWLFFFLGVAFSVVPLINSIRYVEDNKDYSHWYKFGSYVLQGKPLYVDNLNGETEYMYPPTAAVLFYAPLTVLNPFCFTLALCCLSAMSWAFCVWSAVVLISSRWDSRSFLCATFPGLAVAPYVWDVHFLGQLNLILLALVLGAFVCARNQRFFASSSLFAAAVSLKAFPLPAIAYFVVRKQWLAVLGSAVSIVAFVWFFPGVVRTFERNNAELKQWMAIMLSDQSGEHMGPRSTIGFSRRNQSLVSCSHRLLRHINAEGPNDKPLYVNVANISPKTAQMVGYGACLFLGAVLLLSCRFRFAPSIECEGLEIAMVITLVPLCSPLAWTYFFCWLLPAWTAIGYWWSNPLLNQRSRRVVKIGASLAGFLVLCALSEQIDPTLQACGVTAWGAVTLFLTMAYIRFQLPNHRPERV